MTRGEWEGLTDRSTRATHDYGKEKEDIEDFVLTVDDVFFYIIFMIYFRR